MQAKSYFTLALSCVLFTSCGVSFVFSFPFNSVHQSECLQVYDSGLITGLGMQPHREYLVMNRVDLQGQQINIPEDVTITFSGRGAIVNGTLKGNGTKLNTNAGEVLGVKLKGTWCVDKISDLLFSDVYLTDTEIVDNLNVIQSDEISNEVIINRDYHISICQSGGSGLRPSSHSVILLKGTISLAGNDCKTYQIIDINDKEDVTIRGGCIVGDVCHHVYVEGTTSEWGMGVNILQSRDIFISDMTITRCIGDGIYISGGKESSVGIYDNASKNINIENVVCDDNRRQGLSIIHVDGLVVRNCSFVNTGRSEFTEPGAGIDIEPNVSNGYNMSVRNVVVENCLIMNNEGAAIETNNTYEMMGRSNYANILFLNCKTDGLLKAQSHDVIYRNCTFKEVYIASVYAPTHITFENCVISGGYGIIIYAPSERGVNSKDCLLALDFIGCRISTVESETRTKALISCYKSYIPNLDYVCFDSCEFNIPVGKPFDFGLTDYSFNEKLRINKSKIDMPNHIIDASGMKLTNNRIKCRGVSQLDGDSSNRVMFDVEK